MRLPSCQRGDALMYPSGSRINKVRRSPLTYHIPSACFQRVACSVWFLHMQLIPKGEVRWDQCVCSLEASPSASATSGCSWDRAGHVVRGKCCPTCCGLEREIGKSRGGSWMERVKRRLWWFATMRQTRRTELREFCECIALAN